MQSSEAISFDLNRLWYLKRMAVAIVLLAAGSGFFGPDYFDAITGGTYHELTRQERAYPFILGGAIWSWISAVGALLTYRSAFVVGPKGIEFGEFGFSPNIDWASVNSISVEDWNADRIGLFLEKDCVHIAYSYKGKQKNRWLVPARYSVDAATLMNAIDPYYTAEPND